MNTDSSANMQQKESSGWKAELLLEFKNSRGKSILGHCRRMGPLTFQRPFYPEGEICHLYLLHPPGGIVGGDNIFFQARIKENAHALITTPGATKFYRSAGAAANQKQNFFIDSDGILEWFPLETIIFPGAILSAGTEVNLEVNSVFFGWDILCLGRLVNKELFNKGSLKNRFIIRRNGCPVYIDHIRINNDFEPGKELQCAPGMRGFPVSAVFIATGVNKKMLKELRELPAISEDENNLCLKGMTLINDLLVARYSGNDPEEAKYYFIIIWTYLRKAILKQNVCMPRIWAT